MTEKKHVAQTLMNVNIHPVALDVMDRGIEDLFPAITEVQGWWGYDLFKRKPGPAYYDETGKLQLTNLDLVCFLWELSKRDSIITIPEYKSRRVGKTRTDQRVISDKNRNGAIIGLQSNQNFFSFSVKIKDMNIVGENSVGDFRTFMLTDLDGSWYEGWKTIQFLPTMKENKWLYENKLFTGNTIFFKNFIAPSRWTSFFGHHYFITKLMIERLEEEAKWCRVAYKIMLKEGIKFPKGDGPSAYEYGEKTKGVKKILNAFEVNLQHSPFNGKYKMPKTNQKNMMELYGRQKMYGKILTNLRFMTRASEFAHYSNPDSFPGWLKNTNWEKDYSEKGKRIKWERLVLFQPGVGETAWSILKRTYEKSTEVAA
jgi:hypothetical protein